LDPDTCELTLAALYLGVRIEQARQATGWDLRAATWQELAVLRGLTGKEAPA
jgi:acyl CoA:acetate/3-ketoacid CoA transferase beta subunit